MVSQNSILNRRSLVMAICTILSFTVAVGCGPRKVRPRGVINAKLNAAGKPADGQTDEKDLNGNNGKDPLEETDESKKVAAEIESIKTERDALTKETETISPSSLHFGTYTLQSVHNGVFASENVNNKLAELAVLTSNNIEISQKAGSEKIELKLVKDSGVRGFVDSLLASTLKVNVPVEFKVTGKTKSLPAQLVLNSQKSVLISSSVSKEALELELSKASQGPDVDDLLSLLNESTVSDSDKNTELKSKSLKDAHGVTLAVMKVDNDHVRIVLNYDERIAVDDDTNTLNQSRIVVLTYKFEAQPAAAEIEPMIPEGDSKADLVGSDSVKTGTNTVTISTDVKTQEMTCPGMIKTDVDGTLRCHPSSGAK